MDNSTSDSSEFDLELLQVDFDEDALESMGLEIPEIEEEEKKESKYTRKVTVPIYTIKGEIELILKWWTQLVRIS